VVRALGRAAVVVPNGILFGDGVCARIKQELLTKFNLHTVVRLPNGVFSPYTSIPTNILFFDRTGPTEHIWYYEQPLPEGKKNYTKTLPIQYEEFADCIKWWSKRKQNAQAWKVTFAKELTEAEKQAHPLWQEADELLTRAKKLRTDIDRLSTEKVPVDKDELEKKLAEERRCRDQAKELRAKGDAIYWPAFNLDRKNPNAKDAFQHLPPEQLADDILKKELRIAEIMREIKVLLGRTP
jgi:type I restriction enzyme M protein